MIHVWHCRYRKSQQTTPRPESLCCEQEKKWCEGFSPKATTNTPRYESQHHRVLAQMSLSIAITVLILPPPCGTTVFDHTTKRNIHIFPYQIIGRTAELARPSEDRWKLSGIGEIRWRKCGRERKEVDHSTFLWPIVHVLLFSMFFASWKIGLYFISHAIY